MYPVPIFLLSQFPIPLANQHPIHLPTFSNAKNPFSFWHTNQVPPDPVYFLLLSATTTYYKKVDIFYLQLGNPAIQHEAV